jgi:excisionase family DNA binding protein
MIRLPVSESAKFFGVEQKTIRRAIKAGELRYVVVRGRYKITFESLLDWSQKRPKVKTKLAKEGLGQYVGQWKIKNRLYSPNPAALDKEEKKGDDIK